ncbi:MAG: slipin family protein [Candidatus Diapherotrites archaeon]|uniref:Slipin family protein n=1 Tax=Candidatus Iainarchaeum sp. TaxID=3101447 RepID=A0A8T4L2J3_9ARCH|nr:slipin family protein [Candidatus Diapherotrites archaeon]
MIVETLLWIIVFIIVFFLFGSLKIVNQYERGIKFTLGRYAGIMEPGINWVVPIFQSWIRVDMRTIVRDVPRQDIMTQDNVSAIINAVVYYKVVKADLAVLKVQDYHFAISQLGQTSMRDVIGEVSLDELLAKRELVAGKIREILDKASDPWGIKVEAVELKEIILPESLIRVISLEAEAERDKRAIVIKASGEFESAKNLAQAAKELTRVKGGIHLRTLQTINSLSTEKSKTVVYAIPSELLKSIDIRVLDFFKEMKKK